MRVFCDTSVLVAASLEEHLEHIRADRALDQICRGDDSGFASVHTLAETFSVLSRMPTRPKLSPDEVLKMLERDIIPHFHFIRLDAKEYQGAIRDLVAKGSGGGRIYDMLHLKAASKLPLDRIYTFNDAEWKKLTPEMASLICAPPAPAAAVPGRLPVAFWALGH